MTAGPWAELMCSWCGEWPAVGEDQWRSAPTCERCAMLVVVRPLGWAARMTQAGRRVPKHDDGLEHEE